MTLASPICAALRVAPSAGLPGWTGGAEQAVIGAAAAAVVLDAPAVTASAMTMIGGIAKAAIAHRQVPLTGARLHAIARGHPGTGSGDELAGMARSRRLA